MNITDEQWAVVQPLSTLSNLPPRFQEWVENGTFESILRSLIADLRERGELDLTECFIDGTFVIAKKGARPKGPAGKDQVGQRYEDHGSGRQL